MDSSYLVIALSLSVLISYGFDLLSSRFRTPSVLLLLLVGFLARQLTDSLGVTLPGVEALLSVLGTLGLILIVLEGGLDLDIQPEKFGLVRRTGLMALLTIAGTTLALAAVFWLLLDDTYYKCLVNALPFAIVSSAVARPSAQLLTFGQREFLTYETAFSDIIGILLFNFVLLSQSSPVSGLFLFLRDTLVMAVVSVICCLGLLFLIGRINHRVKFLPIVSVLFLVYAIADIYQLSPLLLILVFGLFLNNTELFIRGRLSDILKNDLFEKELDQIKSLTTEGAFVVRTFFFLLFGYAADLPDLIDTDALIVSAIFVVFIVSVRAVALRTTFRGRLAPLVWVAPRGLITILLYQNIPDAFRLTGFREGIVALTVVFSALVMAVGVLRSKPVEEDE